VDLNFGTGTLIIEGSALSVNLTSVTAESVYITLSEGMIQLEELQVTASSTFKTQDGDITLVTTDTPAMLLNYTVGLDDYCISARNTTVLQQSNNTSPVDAGADRRYRRLEDDESSSSSFSSYANTTTSSAASSLIDPFAPAYSSTGSLKLCYDDAACLYDYSPTITATAPWGALYVTQAISHATVSRALHYNLNKGKTMDTPHFDGEGTFYLAAIREWLAEDPDMDGYVTIRTYGPGQWVGKWLFSTNIAFHYFDPWMFDFVSGGLLVPARTEVLARAIPAQCPYRGGWATDIPKSLFELGGVSNSLHSTIQTTVRESIVLNSVEDLENTKTVFTYVSPSNVKRTTLRLVDSLPSVLSLACSFLLSLILGILGLNIAKDFLRSKHKLFMVYLEAMDRYKRVVIMREVGKLSAYDVKVRCLKLMYERSLNNKSGGSQEMGDEKKMTPEMLVKHPVKLIINAALPDPAAFAAPTPYEMVEIVAAANANSKVNSLRLFINTIAVKRMVSASRMKPIPIEEFVEWYEYFCFHKQYDVYDVEGNATCLARKGFSVEATSGTHTDVFCKIRLKTPRETEADRHTGKTVMQPR